MSWKRSRKKRLVLSLICVGVVSTTAYAYTAGTNVSTSTAGAGANTISGYAVSNLQYTLNSADATHVDSVTFTISPTNATSVSAQLASGGPWYPCTNSAGNVSCTTTSPQASATTSNQLTVVAAQ